MLLGNYFYRVNGVRSDWNELDYSVALQGVGVSDAEGRQASSGALRVQPNFVSSLDFDLIDFRTGAGLCQFVVFVTTIANLLSSGKRRTPLTSLMLKEGVASFILLLGGIQRFLTHRIWQIGRAHV